MTLKPLTVLDLPVLHQFSTGFQQVIHTLILTFKIKGFYKIRT